VKYEYLQSNPSSPSEAILVSPAYAFDILVRSDQAVHTVRDSANGCLDIRKRDYRLVA
jgi:hypothetical protein